MFYILGDNQNKRFYMVCLCVPCVNIQGDLRVFMETDAVFQLDPVQVFLCIMCRIEVLSGCHCRLFHKTVSDGFGEGVFIDDILEFDSLAAAFYLWCRCKLKQDNWVKFVDDLHSSVRAVMVRLIHQNDEVIKTGEIVEIGDSQTFRQPLDARGFAAPRLRVDLPDVENVDVDFVFEQFHLSDVFVVIPGDDARPAVDKFADALKHIFRAVDVDKIINELVIDGEIGGEHEEIPYVLRQIKVHNKGAHQSRLADTRSQRKAQGREVSLEIRTCRIK